MKTDKILLGIAIFAVIVSIVGVGFTYLTINEFKNTWGVGFASFGTANLTVETSVAINFTIGAINWSSGRITQGQTLAQLLTTGPTGTITNGNWTAQAGFYIENIGNTNVTVTLRANKNATRFIGGTRAGYQWNVTAVNASNVGGTCKNASAGNELGFFYNTNTTTLSGQNGSGSYYCSEFNYVSGLDQIRIDLNVSIPEDSSVGDLGDAVIITIAQA